MAIGLIDPRTCIGCGTCVETCPTDVIRMNGETQRAVIAYPGNRQICNMCVNYCPVNAITITSEKPTPILTAWG
jgi:NAD-dependent dihydropyrimidine dehydrogenase PreA subunit